MENVFKKYPLTKKEAEELLAHHGKSEKDGSYDDTVVAQHNGDDVTIGELRKGKVKGLK